MKTLPLNYAQTTALQVIAAHGSEHVIGIDEVGLGCIAGPVTVAAAVLPKGWSHEKVKDSKQISKKGSGHSEADAIVREHALSFCILSCTNDDVDAEGLARVKDKLTEQCALTMLQYFPHALIVQDGDVPTVIGGRIQENMVWLAKADIYVPAVSAASCLAKMYRDQFMKEQSKLYPGYGFETNAGYGTGQHKAALLAIGACRLHRTSARPVKAVL